MGEQPPQVRRSLHGLRQENLPGQQAPGSVILDQKGGQDFLRRLPRRGKDLQVPPGELPLLEVEHRHPAADLPHVEAQHIGVCQVARHHLLALAQQGDGPETVPEGGGLLKLQGLRRFLHLALQLLLHLAKLSLQQPHRLFDGLLVLASRDLLPAVAVTLAHVVVEAGSLLSLVPGKHLPAGRKLQGGPQGVQNGLGVVASSKGPKIPGAVVGHPPLDGETGIGLLHRQPDIGIAFVILQQNIIPGLVPRDEGILQHQGLKLRPGHNGVKVVDLGHHGPGLLRVGRLVVEVLTHPVLQGLGLSHIDHSALPVHHQIDPGLEGQAQRLLFQLVKGHPLPPLSDPWE